MASRGGSRQHVEALVRCGLRAFSGLGAAGPTPPGGAGAGPAEEAPVPPPHLLKALMEAAGKVKAEDLGLSDRYVRDRFYPPDDATADATASSTTSAGRRRSSSGRAAPPIAPAAYIPIYEDQQVTMGIFVLRDGCSIPLHNHPNMTGILRVLLGRVRMQPYNPLPTRGTPSSTLTLVVQPPVDLGAGDLPVLLTPTSANLHEITTQGDHPAAFLDILGPPYSPGQGRDCTYYTPISPPAEEEGGLTTLRVRPTNPPTTFWTEHWPYEGPPL